MRVNFLVGVIATIGFSFQLGCGGSSGGGSISSLSQLPDPSAMVSTSTSTTSLGYGAVSGTAPLITDLKAGADTYFWDGLIATINSDGVGSDTNARKFWGQVVDGPSGQGGCFMAQNTGQVFGRLLESGTSSCYMKNMPTATSGVTVTPTPTGGISNLFSQRASDFVVRVDVSGDEEQGGGGGGGNEEPQNVFIKIFGTDSVGADVYKVQLYFCSLGTPNGYEIFEVNKSTLAYAASSVHKDSETAQFNSSVTATLKAGSGSALEFDTSKDRVVTMKGSFGNDGFGAKITITSDNLIYSLMNHENAGGDFSDKIASVAEFSGSNINDVRFLAAGFVGHNQSSQWSNDFEGALEWHDTYYASVTPASSELYTKAAAIGVAGGFFDESKSPEVDLTGLNCDVTPEYVVAMDFADAAVAAIRTACGDNAKVKGSDNDYCWAGSVQTANQAVQSYCSSDGHNCGPQ